MAQQPDRYQPLPGLLQLPGFLIGKLSPRGRRVAMVVGVLLAAGIAVGLALGIPAIVQDKRETAAAEARHAAAVRRARLAELHREVRPVAGHGAAARGLSGTAALAARRALRGDLVAAILADARRRARTGEFANAPRRVECAGFPTELHAPDPASRPGTARGRYACLAVTAEIKRASYTSSGSVGYPYRALVDFRRGRFAFCKISGRPGEMLIGRDVHVPLPAACGGR